MDRNGAAVARLAERLGGFPAFRDSAAAETLGLLRDHALQDWRDVVRRFPRPLLMLADARARSGPASTPRPRWPVRRGSRPGHRGRRPRDQHRPARPVQRGAPGVPRRDHARGGSAVRLATRHHGDGPRQVALVHGLGADGDLWSGLTERLLAAGGVTVTVVDLRGHGRSERADDYTMAAFADDLVETLPTGLDLVVGHSLGGSVLERAVSRLTPTHALYLDPGFRLGLPTEGISGRLFWATAPVGLVAAGLVQKLRSRGRPPSPPMTRRCARRRPPSSTGGWRSGSSARSPSARALPHRRSRRRSCSRTIARGGSRCGRRSLEDGLGRTAAGRRGPRLLAPGRGPHLRRGARPAGPGLTGPG